MEIHYQKRICSRTAWPFIHQHEADGFLASEFIKVFSWPWVLRYSGPFFLLDLERDDIDIFRERNTELIVPISPVLPLIVLISLPFTLLGSLPSGVFLYLSHPPIKNVLIKALGIFIDFVFEILSIPIIIVFLVHHRGLLPISSYALGIRWEKPSSSLLDLSPAFAHPL